MKKNDRILIVDDNKAIHDDFRKVLCHEKSEILSELGEMEEELFEDEEPKKDKDNEVIAAYEVDSAYQGQEALKMVKKSHEEGRPYALIFMDVRMPPGWDGIETIMRIWVKYPYTEMVLCTAFSDYTWEEIISKLGITDKLLFLRKPFDSIAVQQMALTLVKKWNLSNEARHFVKDLKTEVQDRTKQLNNLLNEMDVKNQELYNVNKELEHVALHDSLTKLPNRLLFNNRLQHTIQMSTRNKQSFAVFVVDLDDFKQINDSHGHLIGDKVLQEVGERFSLVLRTSDSIARLGGDEFAIILPEATKELAPLIAKKIIKAMQPPIALPENEIITSASIGISLFPDHGTDEVTLMKHADIAMYQAKDAKSGFAIFDSVKKSEMLEQVRLSIDLKDAIHNKRLSLYYQPIVNITTGKVCAAEALSRWTTPENNIIPPDKFIPLAEQKGLIMDLTLWVLDVAFKQCAEWHKMGLQIRVSINLSPRIFMDPNLPDKIEQSMTKWELAPGWVILEITESMTMHDPVQALNILNRLYSLGLHISIDDFGTGYSSLSYLKKMPVEELKIDKSFVLNIARNKANRIIVESTINLAHNLGLKVVAEGVEDEEVLKILESFSCDNAQGFYLCRPQPSDVISRWLIENNKKHND